MHKYQTVLMFYTVSLIMMIPTFVFDFEGNFGCVYKGTLFSNDEKDEQLVAVKTILSKSYTAKPILRGHIRNNEKLVF